MDFSRKSLLRAALAVCASVVILAGCGDDGGPTATDREEAGTIVIDQSPDVLPQAGWSLTGPQNETGSSDTTFTGMPVGDYTVAWDAVIHYITPPGDTQTLAAGGTITFSGNYVPGYFVLVRSGTFQMGSPTDEDGRFPDETQHTVTLTTQFIMWTTEVTNAQYANLAQWAYDNGYCAATSASLIDALDGSTEELLNLDDDDCEISFSGGTFTVDAGKEDYPVMEVTWYGAAAYCDWLSLRYGMLRAYDHATWQCNGHDPYNAEGYRLPTEAEWEYACRADSLTPFNTGICLDAGTEANYNGSYPYTGCPSGPHIGWTVPVMSYPANAYHIYEMHGNLFEWCNDWYALYEGDETDPAGPTTGTKRVFRGGYYGYSARDCRSAVRESTYPVSSSSNHGFRPVRSFE